MKSGEQPKPAISIFWDNDNQVWSYNADGEQLKNGEMIEAVLYMTMQGAKFKNSVIKAQTMQQQAMQAAQEQAIRQSIIKH